MTCRLTDWLTTKGNRKFLHQLDKGAGENKNPCVRLLKPFILRTVHRTREKLFKAIRIRTKAKSNERKDKPFSFSPLKLDVLTADRKSKEVEGQKGNVSKTSQRVSKTVKRKIKIDFRNYDLETFFAFLFFCFGFLYCLDDSGGRDEDGFEPLAWSSFRHKSGRENPSIFLSSPHEASAGKRIESVGRPAIALLVINTLDQSTLEIRSAAFILLTRAKEHKIATRMIAREHKTRTGRVCQEYKIVVFVWDESGIMTIGRSVLMIRIFMRITFIYR